MTGRGIVSSVWGMILQCRNTVKVSIELPVATRHHRYMTEKLLKATFNPNKQQQQHKGCAHYTVHSLESLLRHIYHLTERDTRMLTCIASYVGDRVRNRGQDNVTNINTGSGVGRIIFKRQQCMHKKIN